MKVFLTLFSNIPRRRMSRSTVISISAILISIIVASIIGISGIIVCKYINIILIIRGGVH